MTFPRFLANARSRTLRFIQTLAWSPDASAFAVTTDSVVHVWRTPVLAKEYSPLALQRRIRAHNDDVTCLAWSPDGLFLASGSEDLTIRITRVGRRQGTRTVTLAGHRDFLVAVFFSEDGCTATAVFWFLRLGFFFFFCLGRDGLGCFGFFLVCLFVFLFVCVFVCDRP